MIFQLLTIFILLHCLTEVLGSCHSCQSNFAICHDERHFTMCTEGISGDEMQICPDGFVCNGEPEICLRNSGPNAVQPTCEMACGLCNSPGKLFACIGETTYAFCFAEGVPDYTASGICPDGYVCNLGSNQVCTLASDVYPSCFDGASHSPTTISPPTSTGNSSPTNGAATTAVTESESSSSTATPDKTTETVIRTTSSPATTTNNPTTNAIQPTSSTRNPRDESAFCRDKQQGGLYKSENDPTCQEFILCYVLSGQYLGIRYTCPGSDYFNDHTKKCEIEKPSNC